MKRVLIKRPTGDKGTGIRSNNLLSYFSGYELIGPTSAGYPLCGKNSHRLVRWTGEGHANHEGDSWTF
jgi:hypothetical protein